MKRCLSCARDFSSSEWRCPSCGWAPSANGHLQFAPLAEADAAFPAEAFEQLAALEDRNFWFRSRNRLIAWALGRYFGDARRVLEVGCGSGAVLASLRRAGGALDLVGGDIHVEALSVAEARAGQAELLQFDARAIPFSCDFDVVCAFDVLEHIDEDDLALAELYRAARPGGGLLVTVPQHPALWSAADDYGRHKRRYRPGELERRVRDAGFAVIRSTGWVTALLPALAISRVRDRRLTARYDPLRELSLSPWLNRTLEAVLTVERAAIRAGVTLPFGASRLLVARRP